MPQAATIESLPGAVRMMKAMQAQGIEWGEDYRAAAADALKEVLEGRMAGAVGRRLSEMAARGEADRRNGSYRRWLMTELGEIELSVPRTRTWSVLEAVRTYARCAALPTVYPRIPRAAPLGAQDQDRAGQGPQGRRLPEERPRRAAHLLALPEPRGGAAPAISYRIRTRSNPSSPPFAYAPRRPRAACHPRRRSPWSSSSASRPAQSGAA